MWISHYDEDSDLSVHTLLYLSSFIIKTTCNVQNVGTQLLHKTTICFNRDLWAPREEERCGEKKEIIQKKPEVFFLRLTTADEFGCPGLLNHHGAADSSAETNDFDFTCDTTSKLWSQSIAKNIYKIYKKNSVSKSHFLDFKTLASIWVSWMSSAWVLLKWWGKVLQSTLRVYYCLGPPGASAAIHTSQPHAFL